MKNLIVDIESSSNLQNEFKIYSIDIKPFREKIEENRGFYIELKFEVYKSSANYNKFFNHTNQDFDKEFYLELGKDNIYVFKEAVTYTPTTYGVLKELNDLKDNKVNENYRFITSSYLYKCIQTLANFWD